MKKNKVIIIIVFISLIFILVYSFIKNDGMSQRGINQIKYRTFMNKTKWDNWTKNGQTSGRIMNDEYVTNIQLKIKQSNKISYRIYSKENGWSKDILQNSKIKNKTITGIDIDIYKDLKQKYDICYRTYNKKDKWLGWSCNGEISGNKKEKIKAIQIKIIPKNIILDEYLKDYDPTLVNNKNF